MWPNPQETADLVTFTEEIPSGKPHFLRSLRMDELVLVSKDESPKRRIYVKRRSL